MMHFRWIYLFDHIATEMDDDMDEGDFLSQGLLGSEDKGADGNGMPGISVEASEERGYSHANPRASPDATSMKFRDSESTPSVLQIDTDESNSLYLPVFTEDEAAVATSGENTLPESISEQEEARIPSVSQGDDALMTVDISQQEDDELFADVHTILNVETRITESDEPPHSVNVLTAADISEMQEIMTSSRRNRDQDCLDATVIESVKVSDDAPKAAATPLETMTTATASGELLLNSDADQDRTQECVTAVTEMHTAEPSSEIIEEQEHAAENTSEAENTTSQIEALPVTDTETATATETETETATETATATATATAPAEEAVVSQVPQQDSAVAVAPDGQDVPTAEANYFESLGSNTQDTPDWGILTSASAESTDSFQDNAFRSMKWMNPAAPDVSLQIEVEEEEVAVHVPFTPKKETPVAANLGALSESSFNSNNTTPFARVLPMVTPPRSAPLSAQNSVQSNRSFGSPEILHLPEIASTRSSFAHSTKAPSSRPVSQEKSSRSQSMKSSFPSPSVSFSQHESVDASPMAALFNLDTKLSPSAKFRSFIKSLQPVKSGSADEGGDMAGVDVSAAEGSVKLSTGSVKDVQARIAKVQAEQERFRQTEKLKRSMLGVSKRLVSFQNGSTGDLGEPKRPTLKVNKSGAAQNFNANSIRAGLTRQEFRDTIEVGSAIVHRSPEKDGAHAGESAHPEKKNAILNTLRLFQRDHHDDHIYEPHPVTRSGEGYMSEADWKITVKDKFGTPKNTIKTSKRSMPLSHRDGLALQRANAMSQTNSNLNLEQFIEIALKEPSKHTDSVDCPGEPDVPLCYLQSAHLIDRRFGWDARDHSVVKHEATKHKSWATLRAVVQSTGAFHLIAAATAPVMHEDTAAHRNKLMQPEKNAPYIVQEATPITEFVAGLLKSQPRAGSPDGSVASTAERPFTSPGECLRTPHFSIAKQIPQRLSPDRKISPPGPKLKALSKEEAKSIKINANTKEFHDRYNGLIFRDSSRDLTWHDTEDMILGTVRPRKNELLLHRGDMRWAGKTLNMFRPWSAAREMDAMDKFRLKRADTVQSKSLSLSKPGTPGNTAPGSPSSVIRGKDGSPNSSVNPTDRMLSRYNSKSNLHATHPAHNAAAHSPHSPHSVHSPARGSVHSNTHGGASVHKGAQGSRGSASKASRASNHKQRGSVSGSIGSAGAGSAGGIPASVTFAVSAHHHESDNVSQYTLNSNMHGSRSSTSKRAPLLINVVKPLPLPPIQS